MRKKKQLLRNIFGILFIAFILIHFIPSTLVSQGYMIVSPGVAEDLGTIISVKDGYKANIDGELLLTAVTTQYATVWDIISFKIQKPRGVELDPMSEHLPEGVDVLEYFDIMTYYMEDSKKKAQTVALRRAGYEVETDNKGVLVSEIMEGSNAKGKLEKGDIILKVDDKRIEKDSQAVDQIRSHKIGEKVKITVKRDEKIIVYNIKTVETKQTPDKASLGIMIFSNINYDFPREVIFETKNIAGPSAGGMFALEIYNQLVPDDITKGKRIAGTGTIDLDGKIGEIDGVEQKVMAAEKNNAELFFSPVVNYEKAAETASKIKVVSVDTFDDMLNYLKRH